MAVKQEAIITSTEMAWVVAAEPMAAAAAPVGLAIIPAAVVAPVAAVEASPSFRPDRLPLTLLMPAAAVREAAAARPVPAAAALPALQAGLAALPVPLIRPAQPAHIPAVAAAHG